MQSRADGLVAGVCVQDRGTLRLEVREERRRRQRLLQCWKLRMASLVLASAEANQLTETQWQQNS
eukprot:31843-Hanusia_phi.AAC.1